MLEDLSDAIELVSTGTYVVTRRGASGYSQGRATAPTTSTLRAKGSFQPMSGRELERLPEGMRSRELRVLYTATRLQGSGPGHEPDTLADGGETWEVQTVEPWVALGGYYRVVLAKVEA